VASRADDPAPARPTDWRDTLRDAADLALVGILVAAASLPIVTAGAAVGVASAAIHDRYADGHWPELGTNARRYVRGVLPGVPATVIGVAGAALLAIDLSAIRSGAVPGGTGLFAVTVLVAVILAGVAGCTVVEVGRTAGRGWWPAARRAGSAAMRRPLVALAAGGVIGFAAFLAILVPITAPIVVGYCLAGLYAVARRLA
jgi:hypothetical protein